MASPTPNKGYTYPAHGGAVNAWDTPLNQNFDQIDLNVAGVYNITLSTTTVAVTYNSTVVTAPSTVTTLTPPSSIAQNLYYLLTGTITANLTINFPAVGGLYIINNNSSGSFTVSAANAGGGTTVNISQGGSTIVVSEGATNMDNASGEAIARLYSYLGDPNTNVTGTMATANGGVTDFTWDVTNKILYASESSAVWHVAAPSLPTPQTYLSPSNGTPIITGDITSSAIYLNRYIGAWVTLPTSPGTAYYPYQSSANLKLLLTNLGSSDVYDIYLTQLSSTGPFLGTSPSWTVGGGSNTPGSGARGVGAGSAQISRATQGFYVNANAMTLTNGTTGVAGILSGAALLLGSVWTSSAGYTACTVTFGQNRRWGISNVYNRRNVVLQGGDNTASWVGSTVAFRPSNNNAANNVSFFNSLAEETCDLRFSQLVQNNTTNLSYIGIGYNSQTTTSGVNGAFLSGTTASQTLTSNYLTVPSLGPQTVYSLEKAGFAGFNFYGTNALMQLSAQWRA